MSGDYERLARGVIGDMLAAFPGLPPRHLYNRAMALLNQPEEPEEKANLLDFIGIEVERDNDGKVMICTGCGSVETLASIKARSATAFCCCPERKMVHATPAPPVDETDRLREALEALLARDIQNTCQHENTNRGGAIWEICSDCGAKWADDEGGKPDWHDPPEWTAARAALADRTQEVQP